MTGTEASAPVRLEGSSGSVALKWHRARRSPNDAPFRPDRIVEGVSAGAVVEIDLQPVADGYIVLHDDLLDEETDGSGVPEAHTLDQLRALTVQGEGGASVLSLQDFADLIEPLPNAGGHIQLDLKFDPDRDPAADIAAMAPILAPIADRLVLSGVHWELAMGLRSVLPGAKAGFEPILLIQEMAPQSQEEWDAVPQAILDAAPDADWVYLYHKLIMSAWGVGSDLITPLQQAGRKLDAWTIDVGVGGWLPEPVVALVNAGVDQITTNGADEMLAAWRGDVFEE